VKRREREKERERRVRVGKERKKRKTSGVSIWCCSASPPGVNQVDGLPPAPIPRAGPERPMVFFKKTHDLVDGI